MAKIKISELPELDIATLDTTYVAGVYNNTTYKIPISKLTSSLDTTFATDLVTSALSSSLNSKLSTSSYSTDSASFNSRIISGSSVAGTISGSAQISALGFVTGSYTTITSFNNLTQSFNSISQSFTTISGSFDSIDFSGINAITSSYLLFTQSYYSASVSFDNRIDGLENATSSYLTSLNGAISSSAQVLNSSGIYSSSAQLPNGLISSSTQLPSNLISGSSQITTLGFISTSTDLTSLNTISASYLTFTQSYYSDSSSFNSRIISGSLVAGTISSSAQITAFGFVSGSYLTSLNGALSSSAQVLNGSGIYSSSAQLPIGLLSSSLGFVVTSSYTTDSASFNSRIISGSAVVGTISGSSQIAALGYATTSSVTTISASAWGAFQSASSYSSSLQTSITTLSSSVDSRLDSVEATIISGSPNYTQVLGNRRTGITSVGTSIISGSITTTGNPVQIMVTGDANPIGGTAWARLQIFRDGNGIGNIIQVENNSNLNVPYCLNVIDTPSAGTYTYSMRIVDGIAGTLDFGESTGPLLTAVELKTNTNLPSTNNTFTGTNRFNNVVTIGGSSGPEGGELRLAYAETGNSLTGSTVSIDIYQNRLRIFEGGGNARGAHLDLTKLPEGVVGELMWKASGMVGVGTFVSLDNLKCTITSAAQGNRGLSIGAVSTTFEADVSGWYTVSGGSGGGTGNNQTYTTNASNSLFNWNFPTHGDMVQVNLRDKTNNRFYRITMMIGAGYISNFISIERLF